MKIRIKFCKYGAMKFIGHLDIMRYFQKAIRRAQLPVAFSGGYSPRIIMSFANPLGVGVTSEGEYFDIELLEPLSSKEIIDRLNAVMVEGMDIINVVEISDDKKKTGMSIVAAADYVSSLRHGTLPDNWKEKIHTFLEQHEILIDKKTKKNQREVDIRPMIYDCHVQADSIYMKIATGSVENLKPSLVMEAFTTYLGIAFKEVTFTHHRLEVYANSGTDDTKEFIPLEALGTVME
ncbi:MAG: TIGR03936 family radical SAM-associated protein [Lachnospiraceae bacterium]